ncbi:MAG: DUF4783 domain-containing protein [Bacteroidota bacterium]
MRTLIALVLFGSVSLCQTVPQSLKDPAAKDDRGEARQTKENPQSVQVRSLFNTVESAVIAGNVGSLSPLFAKQVSMTIRGSESGFFSSAQGLTILKNFFSARKPSQFSFSRLNDSVPHPYATGRLDFIMRGSKESVQVYVSLVRQDSRWIISQFNIY